MGTGALYNSNQTLLEERLIEEVEARKDREPGRDRRRDYRMTPLGRKLARRGGDACGRPARGTGRKAISAEPEVKVNAARALDRAEALATQGPRRG
jgi:hypothetical protein